VKSPSGTYEHPFVSGGTGGVFGTACSSGFGHLTLDFGGLTTSGLTKKPLGTGISLRAFADGGRLSTTTLLETILKLYSMLPRIPAETLPPHSMAKILGEN
jgi:hypothetical protein